MIIESMAEIAGIVNIVCIGVIVGGSLALVVEELINKLISEVTKEIKILNKQKLSIILKTNKSLLCIKNGNFLLVEKIIGLLKDKTIKKLKAYNTIKQLNICEDGIAYTRAYYTKKYSMVVWIFLIMNIISFMMIMTYSDSKNNKTSLKFYNNMYEIPKPSYGESSKNMKFNLEIIDPNGIIKKSVLDIDIEPNRLNIFDEVKLIEEAKDEIYKKALGENKSYDKVYFDLNFISKVSVDSHISVTWKTDESSAIGYDGAINYEYLDKRKIQKKIDVTIIAIIKYFDRVYEYPIELTIYKKREDEETKVLNAIKDEVNNLNKQHDRHGVLTLPKNIDGYHIKYIQEREDDSTKIWCGFMLIGIVCIVIIIRYKENDFKKDIKDREEQLIMYYSEIVTKIKMLVIAGLTIEGALQKICEDYVKNKTINYAYEELLYTYKDIEVGTSTIKAIELMGKRIGMGPYIRLSSIIIQNIKNGTDSFINSLDAEIRTLERKREEAYIKKGGELGAKLLLPMMMLMGITLLIVMLPALLTM